MAQAQLGAEYDEVLSDGASEDRVGAQYDEVLSGGSPEDQLGALYIEVLAPAVSVFVGWGVPL